MIALLAVVACAHAAPTRAPVGGTKETVISLREIDCQSCGQAVTRLLEAREGVVDARFDQGRVEVSVTYDPARTSPEKLIAAVRGAGYRAESGAGRGAYATDVRFSEDADVKWISSAGEDVDIDAQRAEGKVTVIDFYATWCGPCREVDREMVTILENDPGVALRKVNVVEWESPVAKRYLTNVPNLPYVIVYARSGARVRVITGLDLPALRSAIQEGKTR